MDQQFSFTVKSICFDENYLPSDNTRITTNFANLARGQKRQENLRNALRMIDNRFNALAHWDNPQGDRYAVQLEIISVEMKIEPGSDRKLPCQVDSRLLESAAVVSLGRNCLGGSPPRAS